MHVTSLRPAEAYGSHASSWPENMSLLCLKNIAVEGRAFALRTLGIGVDRHPSQKHVFSRLTRPPARVATGRPAICQKQSWIAGPHPRSSRREMDQLLKVIAALHRPVEPSGDGTG